MNELNKYFTSETVEILRSAIQMANYNPRKISPEAKRKLKANIKKNGIIGGLVWNKNTSNLVSGHQRLTILDELNEGDYMVKVEQIEVDDKTEKELNIFFNNTSVQGEWDYDSLRTLIPDIDYKSAGLTEEDMNLIGVDFLLQTEQESLITEELSSMMAPVEKTKAEKIAHNKEVKAQVQKEAQKKAEDMNAYVMISFDSYEAKADFMERFGYNAEDKFIKGEVFQN